VRDLILTLLLLGLLPLCYKKPFVGLVVFSWLAYMRVQDLTWGFARNIRWSYYVAIVTAAGYMVSPERRRWFLRDVRCYMMMGLVLLVGLGIVFAKEGTPGTIRVPLLRQFERYLEFVKIVAIALFTTAVVTTRERLRVMCWVIALSLGFYGVKSGLWGLAHLGGVQILRGPGGMLQDNNDLSLALSMAVPMLFHLGWTERKPEIRKAFWFALPLTVITIGLTHSRGGFLSVAAAIGVLVWRSRNRFQGIAVGFLVALAALVFAPASYKERIASIAEYKTEGSASSRLRAWGIATRMAVDNPALGVGMYNFRNHFANRKYNPIYQPGDHVIVAHSSYFQIWAECGTPALLLYFGLIFGSLMTCWRVRALARRRYHTSWIINYATMFEASLAAFLVGSTFLNRAHFDLFYHWVAIVLVFGVIARREMENELLYPELGSSSGGRGELRLIEHTGFGPRARRSGFREALARP
jgi:probable O-glycosylation ligase (exosortase A-associated)